MNGYFSIPRSLIEDPLWYDLPDSYQRVFITLLSIACYKPRKFDNRGHLIDLFPGDLCITIRELSEKCGKWTSKNDVERALNKFLTFGWITKNVRQESRQYKSILSITHKDTYELIIRGCETECETKLRQNLDKTETQKNKENKDKKENKNNQEIDHLASSMIDDFYKSLLEFYPSYNIEKCKKTKAQILSMQRLLKIHGEIKIREVWAYAHKSPFWITHVHTPSYLEKKFETLHLQLINPQKLGFSKEPIDRRTLDMEGNPFPNPLEGRC